MSYDDVDESEYDAQRYIPASKRRLMELQRIASRGKGGSTPTVAAIGGAEGDAAKEEEEEDVGVRQSKTALLHAARQLKAREALEAKSEAQKAAEEERKILEAHAARRKLASDMELAKGIEYSEPLKTSWTAPRFIRARTKEEDDALREKNHVIAEGKDVPPIITNFRVRSPRPLLASRRVLTDAPLSRRT